MTAAKSSKLRFDLPTIEEESKGFWDAAHDGRLVIGKCGTCSKVHYYPRPFCPFCWSEDVSLTEASGKGTIYTFSIVHMNDLPPFNEKIPYVVAIVDLDEGVRLSTNIIDCDHDKLKIGMPVQVAFEQLTDDISKPVFRPA